MAQGTATSDSLAQGRCCSACTVTVAALSTGGDIAIEEGNTDKARQIATDHLQSTARDSIMQRIDYERNGEESRRCSPR
jgi:hypothetical protein